MVHGLFRASGIVMIYRCHHAQARRRQVRMPGSLLESTGGSIFPSAEATTLQTGDLHPNSPLKSLQDACFQQTTLQFCPVLDSSDPASQEFAVLQEPEWGADGRPVHELDSHLRVKRSQSFRLSQRVTAARRRVEAGAVGVDALELPRDAGADRCPFGGCGIRYAESCMAEKDSLRPCRSDIPKWPPNGHPRRQNRRGFLARHGNRRKCSAPASTPASLRTTNRPSRCRSAPCGNPPSGGAGLSPCR